MRFLAGPARIGQFLDLGAGLPAGGSTHEIAQGIAPAARIVYADHDPAIIMHAKTLLTDPRQAHSPEGVVSYLDADHNVDWTTNTGLGMMQGTSPSIATGPL